VVTYMQRVLLNRGIYLFIPRFKQPRQKVLLGLKTESRTVGASFLRGAATTSPLLHFVFNSCRMHRFPSSIVAEHASLLHCCKTREAQVLPPLSSFMRELGFVFNGEVTVANGGLLLHLSCSCVGYGCKCATRRYGA